MFLCPCVKETFQDHEVWIGKERERRGRRTCEKDGLDLYDSPSCGIPSHFSRPNCLLARNVRRFYSESSLNYSKRCKRESVHTWAHFSSKRVFLCQRYVQVISYFSWEVREKKGSSVGQVLLGILENLSEVAVNELRRPKYDWKWRVCGKNEFFSLQHTWDTLTKGSLSKNICLVLIPKWETQKRGAELSVLVCSTCMCVNVNPQCKCSRILIAEVIGEPFGEGSSILSEKNNKS